MQVSIGDKVKVNHPITCLNPEEWFTVVEIKFYTHDCIARVRGDNTCWFSSKMIIGINGEEFGD